MVNRLMWWCGGGIAALAAVLAVVTWFAWSGPRVEPPRAREFRDYDVCLLTGDTGVTVKPASDAWQALQTVSDRTAVRAFHVQVSGEQTPERASQFVATLVQQRCGIIVSVGENQIAGAAAVAANYPNVTFIDAGPVVDPLSLASRLLPLIPPR